MPSVRMAVRPGVAGLDSDAGEAAAPRRLESKDGKRDVKKLDLVGVLDSTMIESRAGVLRASRDGVAPVAKGSRASRMPGRTALSAARSSVNRSSRHR